MEAPTGPTRREAKLGKQFLPKRPLFVPADVYSNFCPGTKNQLRIMRAEYDAATPNRKREILKEFNIYMGSLTNILGGGNGVTPTLSDASNASGGVSAPHLGEKTKKSKGTGSKNMGKGGMRGGDLRLGEAYRDMQSQTAALGDVRRDLIEMTKEEGPAPPPSQPEKIPFDYVSDNRYGINDGRVPTRDLIVHFDEEVPSSSWQDSATASIGCLFYASIYHVQGKVIDAVNKGLNYMADKLTEAVATVPGETVIGRVWQSLENQYSLVPANMPMPLTGSQRIASVALTPVRKIARALELVARFFESKHTYRIRLGMIVCAAAFAALALYKYKKKNVVRHEFALDPDSVNTQEQGNKDDDRRPLAQAMRDVQYTRPLYAQYQYTAWHLDVPSKIFDWLPAYLGLSHIYPLLNRILGDKRTLADMRSAAMHRRETRQKTMNVSLELLAQLLNQRNMNPCDDIKVVRHQLQETAAHMMSIALDRASNVNLKFIISDTVDVAHAYVMHMRRRREVLPFH